MNYEELACIRPMGKLLCQWSVCFAMVLKGLHVDWRGGGGWGVEGFSTPCYVLLFVSFLWFRPVLEKVVVN